MGKLIEWETAYLSDGSAISVPDKKIGVGQWRKSFRLIPVRGWGASFVVFNNITGLVEGWRSLDDVEKADYRKYSGVKEWIELHQYKEEPHLADIIAEALMEQGQSRSIDGRRKRKHLSGFGSPALVGSSGNPISPKYLDVFFQSYIETALWSSTGDDDQPMNETHTPADIAKKSRDKMRDDCAHFVAENDENLSEHGPEDGGYDFWLTRNGHGAGFWDGNWSEKAGKELTAASKRFSEQNIYVGDDGRIYVYGAE